MFEKILLYHCFFSAFVMIKTKKNIGSSILAQSVISSIHVQNSRSFPGCALLRKKTEFLIIMGDNPDLHYSLA